MGGRRLGLGEGARVVEVSHAECRAVGGDQHHTRHTPTHMSPPPSAPPRDEHHGWQLYQSDPSGNYGGWKAVAIGNGHAAAQNLLKTEYKEDLAVDEVGGGWRLGGG
jgi:hypothetical protein